MTSINLCGADVGITIDDNDIKNIVMTMGETHEEWLRIEVNTQGFTILGIDGLSLNFMDDDFIVFGKTEGAYETRVTVSKTDIAKTTGSLLEYFDGRMHSVLKAKEAKEEEESEENPWF